MKDWGLRQISGAAFGLIICTFNVFHHTSRFFDRILITSYLSRHSLVGSSKKPHNVGHIYFVQLILCLSRSLQMQSFSKVITCCGSGIPPIIFSWPNQLINPCLANIQRFWDHVEKNGCSLHWIWKTHWNDIEIMLNRILLNLPHCTLKEYTRQSILEFSWDL